jgi:hypothetical protein
MLPIITARYIFGEKQKIQSFRELKLSNTTKPTILMSVMENPAAQMLKNLGKLVCCITVFISSISNKFSSYKESKVCIVLAISLSRSLKNSSVMSLSTC